MTAKAKQNGTKLTTPEVRVARTDQEDLTLQTTNADLVLWDRTRWRHKWPTFQDAPFLWLTFIAWAAARRTGAIDPKATYEEWERQVLEVEALTDDTEEGSPTPPGLVPG